MIKKSFKIFYLLFLANIISFFLMISFDVITSIVFTKEIGYKVYVSETQDGKQEFQYDYKFTDGEDTRLKEFEEKGYTVNTPSLRSEPSKNVLLISRLIAGTICILITCALIYSEMFKYGAIHRNNVKYQGEKEKLYNGFIAGLLAGAPAMLLLLVLTILKSGAAKAIPLGLYSLLNTYLFDFIVIIAKEATTFGQFGLGQILMIFALLLIIPIVCGISFILGYKGLSVGEKLIYKKD